jgi:hypothetical protein
MILKLLVSMLIVTIYLMMFSLSWLKYENRMINKKREEHKND